MWICWNWRINWMGSAIMLMFSTVNIMNTMTSVVSNEFLDFCRIKSNSIEFLRPVFLHALCNPSQVINTEPIWMVLLKQQRHNSTETLTLIHEIFAWSRVSHIYSQPKYSFKLLNLQIVFSKGHSWEMPQLIVTSDWCYWTFVRNQSTRARGRIPNVSNSFSASFNGIRVRSKKCARVNFEGSPAHRRTIEWNQWLHPNYNVTNFTQHCAILFGLCYWSD